MIEQNILIIGATGNLGRKMMLASSRAGIPATAALRNPSRQISAAPDFPKVAFDFNKPNTWPGAIAGHDFLFLVRPPAIANVEENLNPFISFAYENGIKHIVFISVAGADKNKFVPHAKVEKHLNSLGLSFTILRPGFFAQNLQDAYRDDIMEYNQIILPAGDSVVNWIDVEDIAELSLLIFESPNEHNGCAYVLTGPRPESWAHVVSLLTEVLGRKISYQPVSIFRYMLHLKNRKLPIGAIAVQTILHFLLRFGQGATYDKTLEILLGRPPRSIEQYIRKNVKEWQLPKADF